MRRKPIVSLLIGSLVFGLLGVCINLLPEVFGWQQGTLPAKRPARTSKKNTDKSVKSSVEKTKTAKKPAPSPQPPSPSAVTSEVQVQTISAPSVRKTISVFDIVESEPISEKPIGGQEAKVKSAEKSQPVKSVVPEVPVTETKDQDSGKKPAEPAVTVAETAPKASDEKPVGTAIRSVEQQPVVRPTGSTTEKSNANSGSRFGFNLKIPSTDKIQDRLKSLITVDTGKTKASGQGGQAVRSSRRPGEPATDEAAEKVEKTSPEAPRVARKTFSFTLPPIAVPRFGVKKTEEEPVLPGQDTAEIQSAPEADDTTELDAPRPLQFQKLTPGRSSAADLKESFGAAQSKSQENGVETLMFQVGAFQQVKVIVSDQIVDSIQVFFKESYSVSEMAEQLGIQKFEPVIVRDSRGSATGSVYPERGVTFVYEKSSEPVQVKQIKLAPISPVPFLQRAQVNQRRHYQDALDDLVEVQRLDPKNDKAHAMEARILTQMGRFARALEAVDTALKLQPGSQDYQLIQARIQSQLGDWEIAEKTIQQVLESEDATNLQQAEATCLLGDLYGRHGKGEYQVAIQHHLASVKRAKSLVVSSDRSVSRQAKRILLNAHLAIANDIAWGDWQNKNSVVPKWLDNSQALLNSLRKDSLEDVAIPMYVTQQLLFVQLGLAGDQDINETVRDLTKMYNELLDGDADALFKQRIRWMAGKGFYCAGRIAQQQGKSQKALQHATDAFHLLTTVVAGRDFIPRQEILLGDTCFLLGSLQAVYKNDHWEAVSWYQQALKKYEEPAVAKGITNLGLHGERLVSMGLSFWQSEDHQRGLKLTRQGTDMIEQAAEEQDYPSEVLAVPYGNLVAMYRHLEQEKLADEYADRVAELKEAATSGDASENTEGSTEKPAAEEKPAEEKPAEEKPAEEKPAEAKPVTEAKPAKPTVKSPTKVEKADKTVPDNPIRKSDKPE